MYTDFYWWDVANAHFVAIGLIGVIWGYSLKYLVDTGIKYLRKKQRRSQIRQKNLAYHTQHLQKELAAIQQYRQAVHICPFNSAPPSQGNQIALEYRTHQIHLR